MVFNNRWNYNCALFWNFIGFKENAKNAIQRMLEIGCGQNSKITTQICSRLKFVRIAERFNILNETFTLAIHRFCGRCSIDYAENCSVLNLTIMNCNGSLISILIKWCIIMNCSLDAATPKAWLLISGWYSMWKFKTHIIGQQKPTFKWFDEYIAIYLLE